ncbi:MAG TPA: diguanylate cyclase [Noviherbaspirillum sp.]|jgi:diguanylate cyclase|uniref:GGDEF domain-containing protein n=1 Tax=Noviherbaspirillum sp. TaxID=1926288 RepID=UPI002F946B58
MRENDSKPEQQSPADIAREAFKRLAVRRIAPTPDAYREIYEEIAGIQARAGAEQVLAEFAASLARTPRDLSPLAAQLRQAAESRDWQDYSRNLARLVDLHLAPAAMPAPEATPPAVPLSAAQPSAVQPPPVAPLGAPAARTSIPLVDPEAPPVSKSRGIPLVDATPSTSAAAAAGLPLVEDAPPARPAPAAFNVIAPAVQETRQMQMLRDLLVRTLTLALGSMLRGAPALAEESEALAESIRTAWTEQALNEIGGRLKQLCFRVGLKADDMAEEHELLLRLFQLLLENVSELLDDDTWLSGQIANVRDLLAGPITHAALLDATRSLKEVIYKQGALKHSLKEAKVTVKNMMMTFIDRLGAVAVSTGDFHKKINNYQQKITDAKGIVELNNILDDMMRDTRAAQAEVLRSHDEMVAVRREVQDAEARIQELESKLEQMSELVREDQLTGSLNRRGLDDVFEREMARSARRETPLCIALLDLDDFKRLNDTYGHSAGDQALVHLVRVIKETLRTMDVVARFGGEEFMIVLPDTPLPEAVLTVTRVQRELTKRIFMHDNQRLLITFSAGVALRQAGEDQQTLVKRADAALYQAKHAGKNRVVAA